MKNLLKVTVLIMVGVLVITTTQMANAQEFRKELMKGIVQSIGPDTFKGVLKSMVAELAKDDNFRKQIIQEVIGAIGPDGVQDSLKLVAGEFAHARDIKNQTPTSAGPTAGPIQMSAALTSIAGQFTKDPNVMKSISSRGPVTSPQALMNILREKATGLTAIRTQPNAETMPAMKNYRSDLVAVITHPSNPVQTLTVNQVRKLFSGEYTNWSQVGGADLPVKLVTSRDGYAGLEDLLYVSISADAVKVPFLSFLFVGVAETEGAVGFLPTSNVEQLEFVRGHSAIKKIAIKKNTQSPAVSPNPTDVIAGSYPLLAPGSN